MYVHAEAEEHVTTWGPGGGGGGGEIHLGIVDKFLEFHVAMYA